MAPMLSTKINQKGLKLSYDCCGGVCHQHRPDQQPKLLTMTLSSCCAVLCHDVLCSQEAVEALARAGLRNPVKVAVAVTATAQPEAAAAAGGADGSDRPIKRQKRGEEGDQQQHGDAAAAAGGVLQQATPSSLSLEYIVCPIEQKLPQLVRLTS
jgi:hypothetical protein